MKVAKRNRPVIGITADATAESFSLNRNYAQMVSDCGGAPLILPSLTECVEEYLRVCDGFIFSGGGDPIMTTWGQQMHPKAKPIAPQRQEFELALLNALQSSPQTPALGICLGMQMMGLHAGGTLDQHLPDSLATAAAHWDKREHEIAGELGTGIVHSHHRQALTDAGSLRVIARSEDGVIEAVRHDDRKFFVGVQWHPERTADTQLGRGIIEQLVAHAAAQR